MTAGHISRLKVLHASVRRLFVLVPSILILHTTQGIHLICKALYIVSMQGFIYSLYCSKDSMSSSSAFAKNE